MHPEPMDERDRKALRDIEEYGHHVIKVMEGDGVAEFAYSVGLWHSFQQPEIIIVGLKNDLAHWVINEVARLVQEDGVKFEAGNFYDGLLEGFSCKFLSVPKTAYRAYVGWDLWFYQGDGFPLLQCVYPTTDGVFPWDESATAWFRDHQPVLAQQSEQEFARMLEAAALGSCQCR